MPLCVPAGVAMIAIEFYCLPLCVLQVHLWYFADQGLPAVLQPLLLAAVQKQWRAMDHKQPVFFKQARWPPFVS